MSDYYVHAEFTLHSNVKTVVKSGFKTKKKAEEFKKGLEKEFIEVKNHSKETTELCFGKGERIIYIDFAAVECFEVTVFMD